MNEKSIKSMNLTERVDDCKGIDIHYRNSSNITVKTRRYPSNEKTKEQKQRTKEPFLSGANLPSI